MSTPRIDSVSLCPIETRKSLRKEAGYQTRQRQDQPRCDNCKHESATWAPQKAGQHGTGCGFYKLPCLKHAVCDAHQPCHSTATTSTSLTVTIPDLSRSVLHSDGLNVLATEDQITHVLKLALKTVGIAALGRHIDVDLENGHVLHCTVEKRS